MNIESLNGFDGHRSEKSPILGYVCLFSDASSHLYIAMRGPHWKGSPVPFCKNPNILILNRYCTNEQGLICIAARQHENDTCWPFCAMNNFTILRNSGISIVSSLAVLSSLVNFWSCVHSISPLIQYSFDQHWKINAIATNWFTKRIKKSFYF